MPTKPILAAAIAALVLPALSGCGGNKQVGYSTTSSTAPATTQAPARPAAVSGALAIRMTEFAFDPKDPVARAGKLTITATNPGRVPHELVLLKTDADPANLPKKGGEVDERTSVGEIADVKAGASKKATFRLSPGKYVMVCALPGHYEGGMYGSLTVQ